MKPLVQTWGRDIPDLWEQVSSLIQLPLPTMEEDGVLVWDSLTDGIAIMPVSAYSRMCQQPLKKLSLNGFFKASPESRLVKLKLMWRKAYNSQPWREECSLSFRTEEHARKNAEAKKHVEELMAKHDRAVKQQEAKRKAATRSISWNVTLTESDRATILSLTQPSFSCPDGPVSHGDSLEQDWDPDGFDTDTLMQCLACFAYGRHRASRLKRIYDQEDNDD